jgi:sulfotransferase
MKTLIFNSSMPRACSTLLQNIFNQNPAFYATPTDGAIELLAGARERFTNASEFKAAVNQDLSLQAWRSFCRGGLYAYANALTDKQIIVLKSRGWKGNIQWMENFLEAKPIIFCMVRNLKAIAASFEKLHRRNPDKTSQWLIEKEVRGTTVFKRTDMYMKNMPVNISLDRIQEILETKTDNKIFFIKAEDLTSRPQFIMDQVYNILNIESFKHDFNNVKQVTQENDVIHALDNNLHTIRQKVEPIKEDYEDVLGLAACNWIDSEYGWYQKYFGYIS